MKRESSNLDDYLSSLSDQQLVVFEQFCNHALKLIPNCTIRMSYGMPGFDAEGIVIWFAVWKSHYGFYPKPTSIAAFSKELSNYKTSKGCIQFPASEPLPLKLITALIKYRLQEHREELARRAEKKAKKTTKSSTTGTKSPVNKKVALTKKGRAKL